MGSPEILKKSFIGAEAVRKDALSILLQSTQIEKTDEEIVLIVGMIFLCLVFFYELHKEGGKTLEELMSVYRYVSQYSNSDQVLNTHHPLKVKISQSELRHTVKKLEDKLSIGLIEKREDYLKDAKKNQND